MTAFIDHRETCRFTFGADNSVTFARLIREASFFPESPNVNISCLPGCCVGDGWGRRDGGRGGVSGSLQDEVAASCFTVIDICRVIFPVMNTTYIIRSLFTGQSLDQLMHAEISSDLCRTARSILFYS